MNKTWLFLAAGGVLGGFYAFQHLRAPACPSANGHRKGERRPKVVVLGGGFGGLAAANTLGRQGGGLIDVLLVDKDNYHLFTPPIYQVAACGVNPWDVVCPFRPLGDRNGFSFLDARVEGIDFAGRRVNIANGKPIDYDYLIIALGSKTNYFHQADAEKYGSPLKTVEDALNLRNRVLDAFEAASGEQDPDLRRELLSFVIVGGGATGVELAGALHDLVYEVLAPEYRSLDLSQVRIVVVEARDKLLDHMSETLAWEAMRHLTSCGVEVMLNAKVRRVQPDLVETEGGQTIRTRTVVWTAGVEANEVAAGLAVPKGKGDTLRVDKYLRVLGQPGVFAVGDNAFPEDPKTGEPVPMLASVAIQGGETAAKNALRTIRGKPLIPFHYRHVADMVSLGRNSGVAEFDGKTVRGFAGWLLWRTVHLALLTGFRDKLGMALDWTFAYFYRRDTSRLNVEPVPMQAAKIAQMPSRARLTGEGKRAAPAA